ncbi:hypothetical protein [Vibrio sp. HN007]
MKGKSQYALAERISRYGIAIEDITANETKAVRPYANMLSPPE